MNIEQKYKNALNNFEAADQALDKANDALRVAQSIYKKAKLKYDFATKNLRKCEEEFNKINEQPSPKLECEYCIQPILFNEPKVLTSDGWMHLHCSAEDSDNVGFDDWLMDQ